MLALPQEYIGSICEVKSLDNEQLAISKIIKIDHEALELAEHNQDRLPLLQYRLNVKLYIHNAEQGTRILSGVVYLSTNNFLRVEEVKPLQNFERRGAFRVNTNVTGFMMPLWDDKAQAEFDEKLATVSAAEAEKMLEETTFEVKLLDISLTGMRLSSETELIPGECYVVEFSLLDTSMSICLKIQRVIKTPSGETQYGCIFFDFSERQMDTLCKVLFQLQRIEKNKRRNSSAI